ncbi:MAG: hypothetical protein NTZ13_03120 [Candidatus Parcubacteria bacterium]|nr:hypothetical protein [Candidatus Parcubacteria bacterium]
MFLSKKECGKGAKIILLIAFVLFVGGLIAIHFSMNVAVMLFFFCACAAIRGISLAVGAVLR